MMCIYNRNGSCAAAAIATAAVAAAAANFKTLLAVSLNRKHTKVESRVHSRTPIHWNIESFLRKWFMLVDVLAISKMLFAAAAAAAAADLEPRR